jgi:biotin synthase-like enzyme
MFKMKKVNNDYKISFFLLFSLADRITCHFFPSHFFLTSVLHFETYV